ncbi:hypothetical protein ALQ55_01639 [Pseudomonas savastanoi pv. savastanoi]|nr:hypothetical protein ALQ55_01639 [Pseudomonas savastanoi pv. savastanoi]
MLPQPARISASPRHLNMQKWRGRVGMCLVASLSVLAGMTDAIGFMATGDFVSFMSGNTTRLAVAISAGDLSVTLRLALAIFAFYCRQCAGRRRCTAWRPARPAPAAGDRHAAVRRSRMAAGKQYARTDLGHSGNGHA